MYGAYDQASNAILTRSTIYSNEIQTKMNCEDKTSYALLIDKDFDITLNAPTSLRGIAYCNVPLWVSETGSGKTMNAYVDVLIRKWNGTTETEIASGSSTVLSKTDGTLEKIEMIKVTVPLTNFNPSETLRITLRCNSRLSQY
jgi:hypothetical protein